MSKHHKTVKNAITFKRKPLITALEPRILLDGAAVATGAEALTDVAYDTDVTDASNQPDALAPVQVQAADPAYNNGRKEVAFIDTSVTDYESLVAGIKSGVEVYLLNGESDGISQIQRWAQQNSGYDAIHLLSHGDDGQISLGTTVLSQQNLSQYSDALSDIGAALTDTGDLLVYGCNVAETDTGVDFISRLSELTNADVAASDDTTGGSAPADWALELEQGEIESVIAVTNEAAAEFDGSLDLVNKTVHTYSTNTWSYNQLASDSAGTQYLIHKLDSTSISLKTWDGSSWSIHSTITTENTGNTGFSDDLDIQIDNSDNIHIVYRPSDGGGVTSTRGIGYGFYDGSSWSFEWVENASSPSGWRNFDNPILKVDANGKAHLLYEYSDSHIRIDYVRYATNASGSWTYTDLTTGTGGQDEVFVNSLDIDASGNAHAFYIREDDQNTYTGNLYYRALSGGSWSAETKLVDATGESKGYDGYSAVVDSNGKAHITYSYSTYDPSTDDLTSSTIYYKTNTSGSWVTSSIETGTTRDNYSSGMLFRGNDLYVLIDSWTADWSSNNYHFVTLQSGDSDWWIGESFDLTGSSHLQFNISNADEFVTVTQADVRVIHSQAGEFSDYFTPQTVAPTLTVISNITGGTEDTEKEISFSNLTAAADEADADGSVTGFVVKAVTTGTLKIGATAGAATAWAAGSNDTIDATNKAFWTPASNANGNLNAFTVVAKDDANAVSVSAVQVVVEAAAVNDAPVPTAGTSLTAIDEDIVSLDQEDVSDTTNNPPPNWGDWMDDLLAAAGYTDADSDTVVGVAIAADASSPTTEGKWQYSTDTETEFWHDIGPVSASAALLLDPATTYLRFVPVADFSGAPGSLTVHVIDSSASHSYSTWDGSAETRHTFDTSADDATSSVSATGVSWGITVNNINDAPTVANGTTLTAIDEDVVSLDQEDVSDTTNNPPPNWGDWADDLLAASGYADADGNVVAGIAIAGDASNPTTEGKWQYSTDTETEFWHDIGPVSASSALLLDPGSTYLRFVPVADFNGTPGALTVHVIDNSVNHTYSTWDGSSESRYTFDTSSDDATSSVSASGVSWGVTVSSVNDVPTLTTISNITGGTEDTETEISLSNIVAVANEADADGSVAGFVVKAVSTGTLKIGTSDATAMAWVSGSNDTINATNKAFWTPAENANGNLNAFTVVAIDNEGGKSASAVQVVVETSAVNDAPVPTSGTNLTAIDEDVISLDQEDVSDTTNNPPPNWGDWMDDLLAAAGYTDADNDTVIGIAIAEDASNPTTEGKWQYSTDIETEFWYDIGTVSASAALLLDPRTTYLRFVPVADYSGTPGSLTVHVIDDSASHSYSTWNGSSETRYTFDTSTDDATSSVSASGVSWGITVNAINDAPVIGNLGSSDNQTVASTASAVLIDQSVAATISDVDSADFDGGTLTVSFASGREVGDQIGIEASPGVALSNGTDVGSTVTVDSQIIGTIATSGTGSGSDNLVVSLNSQASSSRVATLLQHLNFDTDTTTGGDRVLSLVLTDGDNGTSETVSTTITVTVNPTVAISSDKATLLAGETATITFTFSEVPQGFTASDINVSGGSLSNLAVDGSDNTIYTATFTPSSDTQSLIAQLSIDADTFTNPSGRGNFASTALDMTGDTLVPIVDSIVRATPASEYTNADTLVYRVTFSEAMNSLSASDFSVIGTTATITNIVSAGSNGWDLTLSGGDLSSLDGTVTLAFNGAHAVQDTAGNELTATVPSGADEHSYVVDNIAPTLSIDTVAGDDRINASEDDNSVTVSGSTSAEDGQSISIDVGGVSKTTTASGGSWSVSLSSSEVQGLTEGAVSITADVDDLAGNSATQANSSVSYDKTAPTLSIDTVAGDDRINASEDDSSVTVSGSTSAEDGQTISIDAGGVSKTTTASGGRWSVSLSSSEVQGLTEGVISITADVNDLAGNDAVQGALMVTYDATQPTVQNITRDLLHNPSGADSFEITLQLGEAGSGVDATSINVTNIQVSGPGSVGSLTVTNVSYDASTSTATYTIAAPTGGWDDAQHDGEYTIALMADEVTDLAGNAVDANATAKTFTVLFNTAPELSSNGAGSTATVDLPENIAQVTTVTASDIDNDSLTFSITGGADQTDFSIHGSSGVLTFDNAPDYVDGGDNKYEVEVTVSDGRGGSDTQLMTINIMSDIDGDQTPDIDDDDIDGDGLLNTTESGVPSLSGNGTGDGNGDGIDDYKQVNVASLIATGNGSEASRWVTIAMDEGLTLTDLNNSAKPSGLPRNVKMPLGQFEFNINNVTPGATVDIDFYADTSKRANAFYKLNQDTGRWDSIATATTLGVKTKLSFSLTDGGVYDKDGVANGVIVDPGFVANINPLITSDGGELEATLSRIENNAAVTTVTADSQGSVSYSVSGGADQSKFVIDSVTGKLSFASNPDFDALADANGDNSYVVEVTATDEFGSEAQTLTINLTDLNEAPADTSLSNSRDVGTPPSKEPVPEPIAPLSTSTDLGGSSEQDTSVDEPMSLEKPSQSGGGLKPNGRETVLMAADNTLVVQNVTNDGQVTVTASVDVNVTAGGEVVFSDAQQQAFDVVALSVTRITARDGSINIEVADTSGGQAQNYSGTLADGSALPAWISIDPTTGSVTANPPEGQGELAIRVRAMDSDGQVRILEIKVDLEELQKDSIEGTDNVPEEAASKGFVPLSQQMAAEVESTERYGDQLVAILASA